MIEEVKSTENNNMNGKQKKTVVIKGNTKLGKYNRKAKSHSGANDNNSNNQKMPIKRVRQPFYPYRFSNSFFQARKSIDDTIERIKKKRDNSVELSFEEMVMKNALKFYQDNF